jgi:hypothetical protein
MNRFDLTTPDGPPAQRRTYQSADSVVQGEQRGVYPTEFLNSLSMSGVPAHTLTLQEGCPVILLRNMPGGLTNGTRLIVVKLMQHIIDAEIAIGLDKGRRVFIPRLNITPSDKRKKNHRNTNSIPSSGEFDFATPPTPATETSVCMVVSNQELHEDVEVVDRHREYNNDSSSSNRRSSWLHDVLAIFSYI